MSNQHPLEFYHGSARYFTRDGRKVAIISQIHGQYLFCGLLKEAKSSADSIVYNRFGKAENPDDRNLDLMEAIHGLHAEEIWENA